MKGRVIDDAVLLLVEGDTVATALTDLEPDRRLEIDDRTIDVAEAIPFGHKLALGHHEVGDEVEKYGEVIGRATQPIAPGDHVHSHNLESTRGRGDVARAEST